MYNIFFERQKYDRRRKKRSREAVLSEMGQKITREMEVSVKAGEFVGLIYDALYKQYLNPETRRSGGMHYTSIENIHKVIDPLFLDDLKAELEEIKAIQEEKKKNSKLKDFQNKLASIKWLEEAVA